MSSSGTLERHCQPLSNSKEGRPHDPFEGQDGEVAPGQGFEPCTLRLTDRRRPSKISIRIRSVPPSAAKYQRLSPALPYGHALHVVT